MKSETIDKALVSRDFLTVTTINNFLQLWLRGDYLKGKARDVFENYYRSYINEFGSYIQYYYAEQTRDLFDELGNDKKLKILEVGCGCGTESLWLAMQGYSVTAIDISDDLLEVANCRKKILENFLGRSLSCNFVKRSLLNITDEQYDVIWMSQTFHHLVPRAKVLMKLSELLCTGGKLIISETNGMNPLIQLRYFLLRGFKTVINHCGEQWGNERIIMAHNLVRSLSRHDIANKKVRYYRLLPNKSWVTQIVSRFGIIDKKVFGLLRPLYTHYNYLGTKQ